MLLPHVPVDPPRFMCDMDVWGAAGVSFCINRVMDILGCLLHCVLSSEPFLSVAVQLFESANDVITAGDHVFP